MRIGIDYTPAVMQGAGIGRYTRELVGALLELDTKNQYRLLYCYPGDDRPDPFFPKLPNVTERPLPIKERMLTILWHRMQLPVPVELFSGPLDVFYAPNFVIPPTRHAKPVLTVHDLSYLLVPECHTPELRAYLEKTVPRSLARASIILADSYTTKNDLIVLLDVPAEKIEVVYSGVSAAYTPVTDPARRQQVRERYGLDRPFILMLGTVEPRKNIARLIQAYDKLRREEDIPHILVIAGKRGWVSDEIYATPGKLGIDEHVMFLDYVAEADLPALYSAADLFAYPSLYEGFGLPPLEAMACGTPVVCSNTTSLPEVVGDAALTVDPRNTDAIAGAMHSVLTDYDLREQMIARGLHQASQFTWQAAASKLPAIFQRAVSQK